jgi:hypothetical protein
MVLLTIKLKYGVVAVVLIIVRLDKFVTLLFTIMVLLVAPDKSTVTVCVFVDG